MAFATIDPGKTIIDWLYLDTLELNNLLDACKCSSASVISACNCEKIEFAYLDKLM